MTPTQLTLLKRLPLALDALSGFEKRTMLALANQGMCTATETHAIPTGRGGEYLTKHAGKAALVGPVPVTKPKRRGGIRRQPDGPAKARERDAAPTSNWDALRAEIVARYEADLAALDRVRAIAEAVQA